MCNQIYGCVYFVSRGKSYSVQCPRRHSDLGMFCANVFSRRAGRTTPKIEKIQKCLDLIGYIMVLLIYTANPMQKAPQMHLHTSPTCFEGTRAGNRGLGARGRKTVPWTPPNKLSLLREQNKHSHLFFVTLGWKRNTLI